jgi:hypothetical protein
MAMYRRRSSVKMVFDVVLVVVLPCDTITRKQDMPWKRVRDF